MEDIGTIPRKIGGGGAKNPNSLANLRPAWTTATAPRNGGGASAGATVKQHWNEMLGWSRGRLQGVADDEQEGIARRCAARRWLAALDSEKDLEQIIGHTDGKARQAVDLSVTDPRAAEMHEGMRRLKEQPETFEQMQALAERLYGGGPFGN